MSAAQFRYTIRTSGTHLALDVRDSATRAAVRAIALANELNVPMEVVRGDATGDKTRVCQARPGLALPSSAAWFVPADTA